MLSLEELLNQNYKGHTISAEISNFLPQRERKKKTKVLKLAANLNRDLQQVSCH